MAESTGFGVIDPMAQSDAWVIVSQRSRSSDTCASRSLPRAIRSMTSTPRVEPIRQGVHLPHDSIAQNSIA